MSPTCKEENVTLLAICEKGKCGRQADLPAHGRSAFVRSGSGYKVKVLASVLFVALLGLYTFAFTGDCREITEHTTTTTPSTTFSIITATNAATTASLPTVDIGDVIEYITYETVDGYFLQDINTTVASTFNYIDENFGLINQTYNTDFKKDKRKTQWQRFATKFTALNEKSGKNVEYKLLFIGRHGEGYHNAAQTFFGTPAWNCYYSELDGNSTATWADAHLNANGIEQAIAGNTFWESEIKHQKIQVPESYYVSPLSRCLETANYTYSNLTLPRKYPFVALVKEFFREGISIHTCDRRSNKTYIEESFPSYKIDPELTEYDEIWNGIAAETSSSQDYRTKLVLDSVFSIDKAKVISITTHSGEGASLLRVLNHIPFSIATGAIIPVLVKATTKKVKKSTVSTVTTAPWTTVAWCTNGAPLSIGTDGSCVCSNGVTPTATTISASYAP